MFVMALLTSIWIAGKKQSMLDRLGAVRIYQEADETTKPVYPRSRPLPWWLGTSAYYVLCPPRARDPTSKPRKTLSLLFVTIDPDCRAAVSEQALWEVQDEAKVVENIRETKKVIERLAEKGLNIQWEGHPTPPTFRIIVVNKRKVLVSFYEPGKTGPECEQVELNTTGLLGRWFMLFFERSQISARRMRSDRALASLLIDKVPTSRAGLIRELIETCPHQDEKVLTQLVDDLLEMKARRPKTIEAFPDHCTLCRILNASEEELPAYDRSILQTANVVVIPALGHFVDGYLLICSRKHFYNFGEADATTFAELVKVKRYVAGLLEEVYGRKPAFFEHGPVSDKLRAGSCVTHAHLHAVPVDLPTPPQYVIENLRGTSIGSLDELRKRGERKEPYFYLECSDGSMFLYDEHILPCQFGRQMIARQVGALGTWDWRDHPLYDRASDTWRKLATEVQSRPLC